MAYTKKYMETANSAIPVEANAGMATTLNAAAAIALATAGRGEWGIEEMLKARRSLHLMAEGEREFSQEVLDAERASSTILRSHGVENRYTDTLSKAAGSVTKNPRPVTLPEILLYLDSVGLDSMPIMLGQDVDSGEVFVDIRNPLLKSASASIIRGFNRYLPPAIALQPLAKQSGEDPNSFVKVVFPFVLNLAKRSYIGEDGFHVTTRGALSRGLKAAAASASEVFKSSTDIPFHLIKGIKQNSPAERIVTAVVLEPETPDATRTPETEADIYSADEICKAMYWWMEEADHTFRYYHKRDGGWTLDCAQVRLLENWHTRVDQTIGTQFIKKGTWMATARVKDDTLWLAIEKGEITGWSIGMWSLGEVEEEEVSDAA